MVSKAKIPGTRTMGFLVWAAVPAVAEIAVQRLAAASVETSSFFIESTCVNLFLFLL